MSKEQETNLEKKRQNKIFKVVNILILTLAFIFCVVFLIAINIFESDNVAKYIANGYITAVVIMLILNLIFYIFKGIKQNSILEALFWNVFIIAMGIGCGVFLSKYCVVFYEDISVAYVGTILICIAAISFFWFTIHILKKNSNIREYDFYSTIYITVLTIVSLIVDIKKIQISYAFLLSSFLFIQILIKYLDWKPRKSNVTKGITREEKKVSIEEYLENVDLVLNDIEHYESESNNLRDNLDKMNDDLNCNKKFLIEIRDSLTNISKEINSITR